MVSTFIRVVSAATCLLLSTAWASPTPVAQIIPSATFKGPMNALTSVGCFKTPEPMADHGPYNFQSKGNCQPICYQLEMPVMGIVNGTNCWCGALIPPNNTQVDDSNCSTPCSGIDSELCGGDNFWTVYLTGITRNKIANLDPSSVTGTSGSPTTKTSTTSNGPSTVVVTATHAVISKGVTTTSKPNTVGIAVGVVVGIVAIAAIIIGVMFFLRQKRRREVEEEYKRQAAANQFVNGGKSHPSDHSLNDARLEPHILQRRESTGSIADNQDYSRRILTVRNADNL